MKDNTSRQQIIKWSMDKGDWVSRDILAKILSERTGARLTLSETAFEDDWTVINHNTKIMYYATPSDLMKIWDTCSIDPIKKNIVYIDRKSK